MKFSYIIGWRYSPDRVKNLEKVLEWLKGFGEDVQIIIVEQDDVQKSNFLGVDYIFTPSKLPFNRSWAFNVGYNLAIHDILVFGDSDLVMDRLEFLKSIEMTDKFDCISPYKSVLDLTEEESHLDLDSWKSIRRPGRGENDNQKINLTGGVVIFTKSGFNKVGKWDEGFIGWGGEDDFQTYKVKLILDCKEMEYRVYHIYHKRYSPDLDYYKRTLIRLNSLMRLDRESVIKYIEMTKPDELGKINKYNYEKE
jgi:hypothetical protein